MEYIINEKDTDKDNTINHAINLESKVDVNTEDITTTNHVISKPAKKEESCLELKNIQYKTMLLNGVNTLRETKSNNDICNLNEFLENEKKNSISEQWCKLNKTTKIKKVIEFVENYKTTKKMSDDDAETLLQFLKTSIDNNRLSKAKDVIYDKENGAIKDIPGLTYSKLNKNFTLKKVDKRVSTSRSLPPKKGTIKHKNNATAKNSKELNA